MPEAIVGRDAELATIERFVAELGKPPRALVIAGEPGIGKTTLWRAAADSAQAKGYLVLETRPLQADARRSFTGLADLVRDVETRHLARLPETQMLAIDVVCRRAEPGARGVDHALIAAAILALARELSRDAPFLVAIDDVQWLDPPSARVLESVARRLRDLPVAFAVAVRTEFGAQHAPLSLETGLGADRVDRLDLSGLGADHLDLVLSNRIGRRFPRATVQRIERASAGNPLFAMGIARSLPEEFAPSATLPVPPSVAEL